MALDTCIERSALTVLCRRGYVEITALCAEWCRIQAVTDSRQERGAGATPYIHLLDTFSRSSWKYPEVHDPCFDEELKVFESFTLRNDVTRSLGLDCVL